MKWEFRGKRNLFAQDIFSEQRPSGKREWRSSRAGDLKTKVQQQNPPEMYEEEQPVSSRSHLY